MYFSTQLCPHWSHPYIVDWRRRRHRINQALSEEHNSQDGSEPLFSMYLRIGEEEDNKMVGRWQKDAEENFLFVSLVSLFMQIHQELVSIDGFIFCRSCYATFGDGPGPQVELSGYLIILPSQHVSDSNGPEHISYIHSFRTPTILSLYIRYMGERAFVSELT